LQGLYRSGAGARPRQRRTHDQRGRCGHDDGPQARLFLCADPDCRAQACICRACDRGHIYCPDCAPHARRRSVRQAGRRYQASRWGRIKHAERARRYRSRVNKVTHHGSPPEPRNASLLTEPAVIVGKPLPPDSRQPPRTQRWVCFRCGRFCSDRLRQGFLRRRGRRNRQRGLDHDDSA
jgi:rubrerythrin